MESQNQTPLSQLFQMLDSYETEKTNNDFKHPNTTQQKIQLQSDDMYACKPTPRALSSQVQCPRYKASTNKKQQNQNQNGPISNQTQSNQSIKNEIKLSSRENQPQATNDTCSRQQYAYQVDVTNDVKFERTPLQLQHQPVSQDSHLFIRTLRGTRSGSNKSRSRFNLTASRQDGSTRYQHALSLTQNTPTAKFKERTQQFFGGSLNSDQCSVAQAGVRSARVSIPQYKGEAATKPRVRLTANSVSKMTGDVQARRHAPHLSNFTTIESRPRQEQRISKPSQDSAAHKFQSPKEAISLPQSLLYGASKAYTFSNRQDQCNQSEGSGGTIEEKYSEVDQENEESPFGCESGQEEDQREITKQSTQLQSEEFQASGGTCRNIECIGLKQQCINQQSQIIDLQRIIIAYQEQLSNLQAEIVQQKFNYSNVHKAAPKDQSQKHQIISDQKKQKQKSEEKIMSSHNFQGSLRDVRDTKQFKQLEELLKKCLVIDNFASNTSSLHNNSVSRDQEQHNRFQFSDYQNPINSPRKQESPGSPQALQESLSKQIEKNFYSLQSLQAMQQQVQQNDQNFEKLDHKQTNFL